jgi:TDG/mug DNA glycosylase family protein
MIRAVDEDTIAAYDAGAVAWRDRRPARFVARAHTLADVVPEHSILADLGCGAGLHLPHLGARREGPVVALDASAAMLGLVRDAAPGAIAVRADLEHLPFRRGALGGAWARASYLHLPASVLPWGLMELHHATAVGGYAHLTMLLGDGDGPFPGDALPGRRFARWQLDPLRDVLVGAGFTVTSIELDPDEPSWIHVLARRARSLPDTVGAGMRLLVCGLNPSVYAAEAGIGFARPGNRFWPAARAAGIVERDRDPRHALVHHGVGMTDLAKRATARAEELTPDEYRAGAARVERLVRRLRPGALCFVGLSGYRIAVDRKASAGVQPEPFGSTPTYVMPNTSGVNARVSPGELAEHLRAAAALADGAPAPSAP